MSQTIDVLSVLCSRWSIEIVTFHAIGIYHYVRTCYKVEAPVICCSNVRHLVTCMYAYDSCIVIKCAQIMAFML